MLRKFLPILGALLLTATLASAQRNCGAMEVLDRQLREDPAMQERMNAIENHTQQFVQNPGAQDRVVVTIPVVVNVVYFNGTQNISDAQIQTQIDVLNADFRLLNADQSLIPPLFQGLKADSEVNFCLATRDPSGNATTGIRRRQTTVNGFGTNDAVKYDANGGINAWDRNSYLNLWICDLSGGLLGYAQFPGGPAATDGVVCDFAYVGTIGTATSPFNLGRTATHEVGHWLNLRHIWGDANCGSDLVSDTPVHNTSNGGCPAFPHNSTCSGAPIEMTMNYMDYTDDACMYMFSLGQKARMQAVIVPGGSRASLANSLGCQAPGGGGSCGTPGSLSAGSITTSSATLSWGSVSSATSYNFEWKLNSASTWTTVLGLAGTSYALGGLSAGTTYNFRVQAVCGGTSGTVSGSSSFTTSASQSCSDVYESNNTRSTAKVIPVNTAFNAQIAFSGDNDWYRFSNTSTNRRIKIELTNLPFDYDVQLYRNNGLLATSENGGTTSETIILNTTNVSSSYFAYVYGFGGTFSNTQCYNLKVSLSSTNWREDGSTDGEVEELEIPVVFADESFAMFPNPASDELNIDFFQQADADVQVTVFDASGKAAVQQQREITKGDNRMVLNLSRLAPGAYFVQVRTGDEVTMKKLIKN